MDKYILTSLLLVVAVCSMAQKIALPEYPGGNKELNQYIEHQVSSQSFPSGETAWVSVFFYVGKDGKILRPTVASSYSSIDFPCEKGALAIIDQMPAWIPGKVNNIQQEIPVNILIRFGNTAQPRQNYISAESVIELPVIEYEFAEENTDKELKTNSSDIYSLDNSGNKETELYNNNSNSKRDYTISVADINSQDSEDIDILPLVEYDAVVMEAEPKEQPFTSVEQMPSFPGGDAGIVDFFNKNLKYPIIAMENGIEGKTIIRFIVEKDGSLSYFTINTGFDPFCDREALRVVKLMPKWIPGKKNGKEVRVYHYLPVLFNLDK